MSESSLLSPIMGHVREDLADGHDSCQPTGDAGAGRPWALPAWIPQLPMQLQTAAPSWAVPAGPEPPQQAQALQAHQQYAGANGTAPASHDSARPGSSSRSSRSSSSHLGAAEEVQSDVHCPADRAPLQHITSQQQAGERRPTSFSRGGMGASGAERPAATDLATSTEAGKAASRQTTSNNLWAFAEERQRLYGHLIQHLACPRPGPHHSSSPNTFHWRSAQATQEDQQAVGAGSWGEPFTPFSQISAFRGHAVDHDRSEPSDCRGSHERRSALSIREQARQMVLGETRRGR